MGIDSPPIAARHSKCWNESCACIADDEVMTTKDYIYLGLILLTAMAFYCNGFYAGVYRCKRMYDTLLDDADVTAPADSQNVCDANLIASEEKVLAYREHDLSMQGRELRGDFGNN
jgi:hypothetical protein